VTRVVARIRGRDGDDGGGFLGGVGVWCYFSAREDTASHSGLRKKKNRSSSKEPSVTRHVVRKGDRHLHAEGESSHESALEETKTNAGAWET